MAFIDDSEVFNKFLEKDIKIKDSNIKISKMDLEEQKKFSSDHGGHLETILRTKFGKFVKFKTKGLLSHKYGIYLGDRKFKSI